MRGRRSGQGYGSRHDGVVWNEIDRSGAEFPMLRADLSLFCFFESGEEAEKRFDSRHDQGITNTIVDPDQRKRAPVFVVRDVGADQGSDAGRIDVGHAGEIDYERRCIFCPQGRLEMKQRTQHDRPLQAQNALAGPWAARGLQWSGALAKRVPSGNLKLRESAVLLQVCKF